MAGKTTELLVGRITGLFGIKGWLKIISYTRPAANILNYQPWYLEVDGILQPVRLRDSQVAGKSLRVALQDISDRETAKTWTGKDIFIQRQQLEPLPAGEYYWADLLGLQVVNRDGQQLGVVEDIYETGANDVMLVRGEGRHLIPLIWQHYLLDVDAGQGIIRVDWQLE